MKIMSNMYSMIARTRVHLAHDVLHYHYFLEFIFEAHMAIIMYVKITSLAAVFLSTYR